MDNISEYMHNKLLKADERTFEMLFHKYFPRLDAYALKFVNNSDISKDIVQEAFISIWEKKKKIQTETFENYLFVSVRNACLNFLKKDLLEQKKKKELKDTIWMEEIYRIDFLNDGPSMLIEEELNEKVNQIMEELPPRCREVFSLSRGEGLKNREIAERLNINVKNVERHISSALKKFREKFGDNLGILIFFSFYSSLL